MKVGLVAGVAVVLAGAGIGGWWMVAHAAERGALPAAARIDRDTMRLIVAETRVKIEVLNASGERGLARRAMHYLRDRGFDVVSMGNASQKQDSSTVVDRSGHPQWAAAAAKAVGGARIQSRSDSARYLDLTIVLGSSFRPPALVLYP